MTTVTSRRRPTTEDEPADEPRARGRRRSEPEDEPAEETTSRRRRTSREEPADEPDEAPRSRRARSDEAEKKHEADPDLVGRGWGGAAKVRTSGKYPDRFQPSDERVLIHFLDDEPFATFLQHWIDERKGQRSFTCIKKKGQDCPLCDAGDRPSSQIGFNIIDFTDPEAPEVKVWWVGVKVSDILKNFSEQAKTKPIHRDDLYFEIFRTGSKAKGYTTTILPQKARDIFDDYEVEPLTEQDLDEYETKMYTRDIIETPSVRELREIARELSED